MVRDLQRQQNIKKAKSFHLKRMFENPGKRNAHSWILDNRSGGNTVDDKVQSRNHIPKHVGESLRNSQYIGSPLNLSDTAGAKIPNARARDPSDVDMMKERFAKLLLGEDMSGGGKGVSSALALSNAITNLAAFIFGEQKRLEPMNPERKTRWKKEIDWLLAVTDHIVEFVPSQQSKDGINMEIMVTRQRSDLLMNIPALRKLDSILIDQLEQFENQTEFWYVSRDGEDSEQGTMSRNGDKWWIPTVKVPPEGLSEVTRRWLKFQKDSVNQVLKAAMEINAQVLSEMEVPENYIESLPKNGRESLGDSIYKSITVEFFDPEQFLSTMDLSTEHKVLDLKNRIEASIEIWKRKMHQKDGRSSWSSGVSLEKREIFEERAETILIILKQRFPGLPQSALDISKIQYSKDVGQAILESYSRTIESLAFTILSRIEDIFYSDSMTRTLKSVSDESSENEKPEEETDKLSSAETPTPTSLKLSDFMGWNVVSKKNYFHNTESHFKGEHDKKLKLIGSKKFSYLEKLESLSVMRSPASRH